MEGGSTTKSFTLNLYRYSKTKSNHKIIFQFLALSLSDWLKSSVLETKLYLPALDLRGEYNI